VVATWRDEQVGREHRLRRLAAEAERAGIATVLRLTRLGPDDVTELVRVAAPERAANAPRLYRETEGLPFFVAEYLAVMAGGTAAVPGEMPGGVRELLLARLASVGETSRQLLAAAAVLGRSFDFDTVREASGRSDEEAVAGLEELVAAGLVREVPGAGRGGAAYDFGHEKLRTLAYAETSLARRRLLHRRAAEALAARPGRTGRDAGAIGHHFQLGGADDRAAEWFARAGEHAHALHANREALGHLQAALALGHPDTARLHAAIGDLETLLGEYDAALASYESAAARADPGDLAGLEHKLGGLHHRRGDWPAADAHYEAALAALGDGPGPSEGLERSLPAARARMVGRARVLADRSLTAHHRQQPERAMALAGEALTLAEAAGDTRALAQAHNILGVLASGLGDRTAARRHLERSLALAEVLPDPGARVAALNNLALAVGAGGDLDDAVELAGRALRLCAAQGDRHREAALHNNLADLLHAAGRHDAAMDHLKRAVAIFAEVGEPGRLDPEVWKLVEW
jgi:tetratricopeptide (TPR) repeat protein